MPQKLTSWLETFALGRFCSRMLDKKLIRFFLVAGLNTLFGWCVFSLLRLLVTDNRNIAALIGQIIGILFNFKTYGSIVFKNGKYYLLPRFIAVYVIMYFANIGGMAVLDHFLEISDYVNAAVMSIPVGFLGFVLNKLFVFERSQEKQDNAKSEDFLESFKKDKSKLAFYILCAVGLVFMLAGSFGAGMSGDEEFHNTQAEHIYDFYRTFGKDSTAAVVTPQYNLPLYGQVVDNFAYAFARWLGISDIMQVRHTVNTLCGWLAILFTSLIAFRIAGRKYLPAILTFVLFVFSPRFIGHSFNDLKDVNLVTFTAMALFYMTVFLQDFPKVKVSTMVMLAVSIGLAMAVRVGGLILIAYFGLFGFLRWIALCKESNEDQRCGLTKGAAFGRLLRYGLLTAAGGYLLCVLLWPYAMKAPIANVLDSLSSMNSFAISIRQVFEGKSLMSNTLPWYYTPKFIFMTIPIAVIAGALVYLVTGWGRKDRFFTFFLLFCFVFPVSWIVYTKANVYGGWRHSMFCYPTLVAMAGLGFHSLYERFKRPALRWGLGVALPLVLLAGPIYHVFANHPYQYVYFNELVGGAKKAYGKYELDYYYHSTRKATEWVMENADTSDLKPGEKITVASWHTASVGYYLKKDTAHFRSVFSRIYQMGNNDWDYAVFTVTGMNPDWITNKKMFPPVNTVHVEEVDGVPICIVLKRIDRNDFRGYQAMRARKTDSAKMFYRRALEYNPYNEQVLENLANLYLDENRLDSAFAIASVWVENVPTNVMALALLCNVYYAWGNIDQALTIANKIKKIAPEDMAGYWLAAHCYLARQELQWAMNDLTKVVEVQPYYVQAYELMAWIYQSVGQTKEAQQCRQIAAQLK
ncbi:MAG: GtrA family protein [Bacteroides sp.]|nr:GtrA family protein [Ruminococcus flavefaciens]MCM1555148.1 GtrA family protein [Bacteroides sp.]